MLCVDFYVLKHIPMFYNIGCASDQSPGQTLLIQNVIAFGSKYGIYACVRAC